MSASDQSVVVAAQRAIIDSTLDLLGKRTAIDVQSFERRVEALVTKASEEELLRVMERVQTTGNDWGYHPPEPFARHVHYAMADFALSPESSLRGAEHLAALADGPRVAFLSNHLSFADANLFEILLHRAGFDDIANRLTVFAGPKVYSALARRFSSLCFGTIKTPQSSSLSSGEAVMTARDVARIARETIDLALARQKSGDMLLIFAEGTRSRTATMQRTLAAVARYFKGDEATLVPIGIVGTEQLVPVGDEHVHPAVVTIRVGQAFSGTRLAELCDQKPRLMMDVAGLKIAECLPSEYRGVYGDGATDIDEARAAALKL